MKSSLDARLSSLKAKGSAARFATSDLQGEGVRNSVASDGKRTAGRVFSRALNRAGLGTNEAADRLGYANASAVSRVASGLDVPEILARWIADPILRVGLIEALAEESGDHAEIRTVVTIGRAVGQ